MVALQYGNFWNGHFGNDVSQANTERLFCFCEKEELQNRRILDNILLIAKDLKQKICF